MYSYLPYSVQLLTRQQQDKAKKISYIYGFFPLGRGRTPKAKRNAKYDEKTVLDLIYYSNTAAKNKKSRTTYLNYNYPKTKAALDKSVTAKLIAYTDEIETGFTGGPFIPQPLSGATLKQYSGYQVQF